MSWICKIGIDVARVMGCQLALFRLGPLPDLRVQKPRDNLHLPPGTLCLSWVNFRISVQISPSLTSIYRPDNLCFGWVNYCTDSKVHGANMGPTWVLSAPDGPHIDPMSLAIKVYLSKKISIQVEFTFFIFIGWPGAVCWRACTLVTPITAVLWI